MVKLIRRFQQPLMILITVIVIISFVWLFNTNHTERFGSDVVATVYGRQVSHTIFQRTARKYELSRGLQLNGLVKALAGLPDDVPEQLLGMYQLPESFAEQFVWNIMVLRHEADRLGIVPTDVEIEAAIKQMPTFQTNNAFDPTKYSLFLGNALGPRGMTADQFEELVGDQVRLRRLKTLLNATAAASPAEVRETFEQRTRRYEASFIRWKLADFVSTAQVSDDDLKKAFEERKATLKTEEKRQVKFVGFTLENVEKPLVGKERVEALGKLGEKAQEFAVAMTEKDAKFEDVAAKFGVKIAASPAFSREEPPKELDQAPASAEAAFQLTKDDPNSDPVTTEKGYFVLQLLDITPARDLTFDEAKPKLAEQLKTEHAQEALTLKATEIRNKIEADLKAGKSFADAATAAGVKAESFPPFSQNEPQQEPANAQEIMAAATELQPNQLSSVVPATDASLIVHLGKIDPIDEAKFTAEKGKITEDVTKAKGDAIFSQWLKRSRTEANVQPAQPARASS